MILISYGDDDLSVINDAEIPSVIYHTFKLLGFDDFTIRVNNRKLLNGFFANLDLTGEAPEIIRIVDKIEKIGTENVCDCLKDLKTEEEKIEKILSFIQITGNTEQKLEQLEQLKITNELFIEGLKELKEVAEYVQLFGVPEENLCIDLTIARGLDYYTGTVYETILNQHKEIGSICSGGRYDNLAGNYTNKKLPGVGISIGLTRLFYILNEMDLIKPQKKSIADVLVLSMGDDISKIIPIATSLRQNGINTEVYLNDKKIKTKFKYADKLQIPYVIIIGEEEIEKTMVSLKNMITGEQNQMPLEEAVEIIKRGEKNG